MHRRQGLGEPLETHHPCPLEQDAVARQEDAVQQAESLVDGLHVTAAVGDRLWADGHDHVDPLEASSYGPRTALGVGMIHGIGAETASQALIIAAVGGAASAGLGVPMLLAFVIGLVISNTVIVILSATGYIASQRTQATGLGGLRHRGGRGARYASASCRACWGGRHRLHLARFGLADRGL